MSRKPQMFDKYDRPTIHHYLAQREEAIRETVEAAIVDARFEAEGHQEKLDFDGMPLNWEAREYEKMLDYRSFMAGDDQEQGR